MADNNTTPQTEDAAVQDTKTTADVAKSDKKKSTSTQTKKTEAPKAETAKAETIPESKESEKPNVEVTADKAESKPEVESATDNSTFKVGAAIDVTNLIRLYNTSNIATYTQTVKGKFYIYNDKIVNGRIRITDSPSGVNEAGRCIGWVTAAAIQKYIK